MKLYTDQIGHESSGAGSVSNNKDPDNGSSSNGSERIREVLKGNGSKRIRIWEGGINVKHVGPCMFVMYDHAVHVRIPPGVFLV
jgi:hypothetical protein